MSVMPLVGLVLDMGSRDGDSSSLLLGSLVDLGVIDELGRSGLFSKVLGDRSRQSRLWKKRNGVQVGLNAWFQLVRDLKKKTDFRDRHARIREKSKYNVRPTVDVGNKGRSNLTPMVPMLINVK